MNGTESMALYEAKKARRVYLYRNGVKHCEPKCMVLNDKHIRDFGTFLSRVTSGLRAPVAIRNIYTPSEGHVVNNLKDLEANRYYVAGGSEQFKKVEYGYRRKEFQQVTRKRITFNDSTFHKAVATSRYRLPPNRPIVIHIYRNGDAYSGKRVLIPSNIARSRDHVMELVTTKAQLFTPAKRLCTLDGKAIEVSDIENGGKYVAMEGSKTFQKVPYSIVGDHRQLIPPSLSKRTVSKASVQSRPVARSERGLKRKSMPSVKGDVLGIEQTPYSQPVTLKRKKSIRPMAGRKNKEGREKAINDLRSKEDSIYGGSPVQYLDESFRTENNLSGVYESMPTTPSSRLEASNFTKSTHTKSLMAERHLEDSTTSNGKSMAANAKTAPMEAESTMSTPRESREVARLQVPKDSYSHVQTRYRTEASRSNQGSRDSRDRQCQNTKEGEEEEFQGISRSEKGVFHASNMNQYKTGEYKDDEHENAFKAKHRRTEVVGAETVQEGQETEVEQPITHLKAEVVEEEEGVQDDHEGTTKKDGQDDEPSEGISMPEEEGESRRDESAWPITEELSENQEDTEDTTGKERHLPAANECTNVEEVEETRTSEVDETKVEEEEEKVEEEEKEEEEEEEKEDEKGEDEEGEEEEDVHEEESYAEEQFEGVDSYTIVDEQQGQGSKSGAGVIVAIVEKKEEGLVDRSSEPTEPAQDGRMSEQEDSSEPAQNSDATLQVPTESSSRTPPPHSSPIATQE